jgi:phospholipase C
MAMSGFTMLEHTKNGLLPDQDMVFDWLLRRGIRWRVYSAGLSFFTLMPKMWPRLVDRAHFRRFGELARDVMREDASTFPSVILVEPDYDDSPVHLSGHACDNHAPLAVAFGEHFLCQVYDALAANPARWGRTLLIVTYDEHGGFFDHVKPLSVPAPVPPGASYTAPFATTGVRVPGIVVSPHVARGSVYHEPLDHTSILQLIAERFGAPGEAYSDAVEARRKAGIRSVSAMLDASAPRDALPDSPDVAVPATVSLETTRAPVTAAKQGFADAVEAFAEKHGDEAFGAFPEIAHWLATR